MNSLTRRQQDVYDFLKQNQSEFIQAPTLDELCKAMGLSSRGSMHKHIQALIDARLVEPMGHKQRGIRLLDQQAENELPFLGYIAAGRPIEAIENPEPVEVPQQLRSSGKNYVLKVKGDSMIDEGILDGDWVVIEQRETALNGEIVVALVDQSDATLKRFEKKGSEIILHPANQTLTPMRYKAERVVIQGVLVGQMRAY